MKKILVTAFLVLGALVVSARPTPPKAPAPEGFCPGCCCY